MFGKGNQFTQKTHTAIYNIFNIHQIFTKGLLSARSFSRFSGKQNRCDSVLAPEILQKRVTHLLYDFLKSCNAIYTVITYN